MTNLVDNALRHNVANGWIEVATGRRVGRCVIRIANSGPIISLLEKLWQDHGLILVIVTHDTSVARRAQRIATVNHGRISVRTQAP